jgi:hypothetical protein
MRFELRATSVYILHTKIRNNSKKGSRAETNNRYVGTSIRQRTEGLKFVKIQGVE